ncbi:MAG TPA: hypothetical protein VES39_05300 [Rhodospirillales bacterium]|nr:hypothetical protein [Rhodospirillales bacterium]
MTGQRSPQYDLAVAAGWLAAFAAGDGEAILPASWDTIQPPPLTTTLPRCQVNICPGPTRHTAGEEPASDASVTLSGWTWQGFGAAATGGPGEAPLSFDQPGPGAVRVSLRFPSLVASGRYRVSQACNTGSLLQPSVEQVLDGAFSCTVAPAILDIGIQGNGPGSPFFPFIVGSVSLDPRVMPVLTLPAYPGGVVSREEAMLRAALIMAITDWLETTMKQGLFARMVADLTSPAGGARPAGSATGRTTGRTSHG